MDKFATLDKIREESTRVFLLELKDKLRIAIVNLYKLRLTNDGLYKRDLKLFFHSVNGTAAVLKLDEMSKIARIQEKVLDEIYAPKQYTHKIYSNLLQALAKIYGLHEELTNDGFNFSANEKDFLDDAPSNSKLDYIYSLGGRSLLFVDDDLSILNNLKLMFLNEDFEVEITSKPNEVLDILEQQDIDLVLLDMHMPETNGIEVMESIRDNKNKVPIIFLTSDSAVKEKVGAFSMGAEDYVLKPFEPKELVARVKKVLSKSKNSKKEIYLDDTTGAYTGALFNENLKIARNRFVFENEDFSMVQVNIDSFKTIKNLFNYETGNFALKQFYSLLKNRLLPTYQIYRLHDDRFLILCPDTSPKKSFKDFDKLKRYINNKKDFFNGEKGPYSLNFTGGISTMAHKADDCFRVLQYSEEALDLSKQKGGNRISIHNAISDSFAKTQTETSHPIYEKIKVLIIEDSAALAYSIKQHLESQNFEVRHSSDGDNGLLKAMVFKPNIIILDLMLPSTDGFYVTTELRKNNSLKKSKIIIITSHNKKSYVEKGIKLNISGFLVKPFAMEELEKKIKTLID